MRVVREKSLSRHGKLMTHRAKVSWVLILFFIPRFVAAQLMYAWSYQEMFDKADLVIIARPLSTKETNERKTLSGDLHFIVNTEFEKRLVLKGPKDVKRFVLHYYKLVENNVAIINRPAPLAFDLKEPHAYLMFLIDKGNGCRYAPVTDEMDPGTFSIIKLESSAE